MASEQCEAIHLTRVEKDFACDTFMPALVPQQYRLWSAAPPRRDNGVRTAFMCYTRAGAATPRLPKAIASRHDELQVCTGACPDPDWLVTPSMMFQSKINLHPKSLQFAVMLCSCCS